MPSRATSESAARFPRRLKASVSCTTMFRVKRARSVIYSLAHHGVSALSWLHPRLGQECQKADIAEVEFDLVKGVLVADAELFSEPTLKAFGTLKKTFERIASSEGINRENFESASILFGFKKGEWPNYCVCCARGNGKEISVKVDGFGRKYGLLSQFQPPYS